MSNNINIKNKLDNMSIKNNKMNYLKFTFLKKNYNNFRAYVNNF